MVLTDHEPEEVRRQEFDRLGLAMVRWLVRFALVILGTTASIVLLGRAFKPVIWVAAALGLAAGAPMAYMVAYYYFRRMRWILRERRLLAKSGRRVVVIFTRRQALLFAGILAVGMVVQMLRLALLLHHR